MFPDALRMRRSGRHGDHLECGSAVGCALKTGGESCAPAALRVDLYPEPDKIGKQFKYAVARGIRFVTIVGEDEAARGEVAVKNLATGEQQLMPPENVAEYIRANLLEK